ncbi:MAG: helix-turn-helix transcriptional regulator [Clostridiales bacterium]|nr:helix-turn-helix transcriptional regulator [Clostridiales bacterium]
MKPIIVYNKLFNLLKSCGHSLTYWLRKNGFHSATVTKLRKNGCINTDTINALCTLLNCQPGDIMEYVPDEAVERDNASVQPTDVTSRI